MKKFIILLLLLAGCTTSSIESRQKERFSEYSALSVEQKQLVNQGKIRVGMNFHAVYISWGAPSEVVERQDSQIHTITWVYSGQKLEELTYWTTRNYPHNHSSLRLERDFITKDYIRATVTFVDGKVVNWQTFPSL